MLCAKPRVSLSECSQSFGAAPAVVKPRRSLVGTQPPRQTVMPSKPAQIVSLGRSMTMTKHRSFTRIVVSSALLAISVGSSGPVAAADIQVLSAAAMQSVFKEIVGAFESRSGHRLVIRYATMGAIHQ